MSDLQAQLADLRKRMASAAARADRATAEFLQEGRRRTATRLEQLLGGRMVQTAFGQHFERRQLWGAKQRHGSVDIGGLIEMPPEWLGAVSAGEVAASDVTQWAFLDIEATGLIGSAVTCPFLVGVGRITPEGFLLKQYFMRDFDEEASMLAAVAADLEDAQTVITYNGKAFDLPVLERRYRLKRARSPFSGLGHLDLLFGARRVWRLRLESCRLVHLESRMLGFDREDDIPGEMIPQVYSDYLHYRSPDRLKPLFEHNALDVLGLACLTAIVPRAFHDPVGHSGHSAEMVSLGRWLLQTQRSSDALELFRRAIRGNLRDELVFRTMWDMAKIERRAGRFDVAVEIYSELAACANAHRAEACVELAKHYEKREKNYALALRHCDAAMAGEESEELQKRRQRLMKRLRV